MYRNIRNFRFLSAGKCSFFTFFLTVKKFRFYYQKVSIKERDEFKDLWILCLLTSNRRRCWIWEISKIKVGGLCLKISLKVVIKWRVSVELCILTISIQRESGSHKFASYKGGSFVLFSCLLKLLDFYKLNLSIYYCKIYKKSINFILT